jgi:hypothetical protein
MKMNRIVSPLLYCVALGFCVALCTRCTDERIPQKTEEEKPKNGNISLKIYVPKGGISTYAGEGATADENRIDKLFIDLYENRNNVSTLIKQDTFVQLNGDFTPIHIENDSVIMINYEVSNIETGKILAKVYANRKEVKILPDNVEIPIPNGDAATSFFMSGQDSIINKGTAYEGIIHLVRDVAKVRVKISKDSDALPSDLVIDYDNVKIQVLQVPNQTSLFPGIGVAAGQSGFGYIKYPERGGLRHSLTFNNTVGGQIDSFYVNENHLLASSYNHPNEGDSITKVKVIIPTKSGTEGAKTDNYTYKLHTIDNNVPNYALLRNYIYTLDIRVRGQSLEPVITVSVQPWTDVNIDGNIYGTYLTLSKSEIIFDEYGKATIDFCTDAQAVYFNYSGFNASNSVKIGNGITSDGIENVISGLVPNFGDGQILLDQQHCGSFEFQLNPDDPAFPGFKQFRTFNYSGKICMKVGNIVKCLTIPAKRTYDAHFIVGDSIFSSNEEYISAGVYEDNNVNSSPGWLNISMDRPYTSSGMLTTYPVSGTGTSKLYLHLDENLTGSSRSGSVVVTTTNNQEKKLHITQLPAIKVGRFGYDGGVLTDDSIYGAMLYTEQLCEFRGQPYIKAEDYTSKPSGNAIYNGRMTATNSNVFDITSYNSFNYQDAIYQAINYCAHKNRITGTGGNINSELLWYLPSQVQLMGMWLSYSSYKNEPTSDFINSQGNPADYFWSSTNNEGYSNQAQYMNFQYGNVGHRPRNIRQWARCVRDGNGSGATSTSTSMVLKTATYPVIDFGNGMPADSYTSQPKGNATGDELSANNATLFHKLRVAIADHAVGVPWNENVCQGYSEAENPSSWRLPTQRELQAIWILQSEINNQFSTFKLLADDYYWSVTISKEAPGTHAWAIYGSRTNPGSSGNVPIQDKSRPLRVRCVSEVSP